VPSVSAYLEGKLSLNFGIKVESNPAALRAVSFQRVSPLLLRGTELSNRLRRWAGRSSRGVLVSSAGSHLQRMRPRSSGDFQSPSQPDGF